jgi:hypothetical protein
LLKQTARAKFQQNGFVLFTIIPLLLADISLRSVFLQQKDWDWAASTWSYDTDGCGVLHLVALQSSTILLLPAQPGLEPNG